MKALFEKNQKGQALLFVVVTMTVALALGVGVSSRTLSSISRTSKSDSATRALAAAEGGAERFLTLSVDELELVISDDYCPPDTVSVSGGCQITFNPTTNDNIIANATVSVAPYGETDPGEGYLVDIKKDETIEINMSGYHSNAGWDPSIQICWTSTDNSVGSDLYYTAYSDTDIVRGGLQTANFIGFPPNYERSGFISGAPCNESGYTGYDGVVAVPLPDDVLRLRIMSINHDSKVVAFPSGSSGGLPAQGYKITSIGTVGSAGSSVDAIQQVTVFRSLPYLPGLFDFGIYSN